MNKRAQSMYNQIDSATGNLSVRKQFHFLYRLNKALYQDSDESTRLQFNILGHHYEIPVSILNNYPNTLLGEPKLRAAFYDFNKDEFVFDRHPHAFESILTFYLSDGSSLSKPIFMPREIFYEELKFFRLKPSILKKYYDQEIAHMIDIQIVPKDSYKRSLWLIINYSTRDWKSQLMYTIDFLCNLIALWTLTRDCISDQQLSQIIYWIKDINGYVLRPIYMLFHLHISTMMIELSCTFIFLLQLCLRVYLAPTYYQIYSDLCFWLEFISILPNFLMYILILIQQNKQIHLNISFILISILRSLRIFRFTRQITSLRVFIRAWIYSIREFFYFFIILIAIIIFFGEFIYLNEEWRKDSAIQTVADGYWLSSLTLTSLAYGDVYPTHIYSRILMLICSILGLILITFPIPKLFYYFDRLYRNEKKKRHIIRYIYSDQIPLRI